MPSSPQSNHCIFKGTVAHELIHALGFWHEQSRPDRDQYVRILYQNIIPGQEYNFNKQSWSSAQQLNTAYDYDSIMHYDPKEFSKNGYNTIEPLRAGVNLVNAAYKNSLSSIDVAEIRRYYNCA